MLARRRSFVALCLLFVICAGLVACDTTEQDAWVDCVNTTPEDTYQQVCGDYPFDTTTTAPATTTTTAPATTTTTMPMSGQDQCVFTSFCDNFETPAPGGRAGDLDETKWSYSRLSQETNPSQGLVNRFVQFNAEHCMEMQLRIADNDSFICGQEFGESNHWMEGFDDNGSYVYDSARALQPFDFAGRTGTFDFSVDAKTTGPHGSWIEAWLTEEPMQAPHTDKPGTHAYPRDGIGFEFDADWCDKENMGGNALRQIDVFNNFQETVYTVNSSCFPTADDNANHFQLKVSGGQTQVWVSDPGGINFRQLASVNTATLPFTRGYWNLQHAQYNGAKAFEPCECGPHTFTYHWHSVSFDGPVVTPDRSYQVPDALTSANGGGVNLGYAGNTGVKTLTGVDLTGAGQAFVTYNAWYTCCNNRTLTVTVNGHPHASPDENNDGQNGDAWRYTVLPIPLSDLAAGTNTVQIQYSGGCSGSCPTVANIDLELVH